MTMGHSSQSLLWFDLGALAVHAPNAHLHFISTPCLRASVVQVYPSPPERQTLSQRKRASPGRLALRGFMVGATGLEPVTPAV